jgi:hypothetical protein
MSSDHDQAELDLTQLEPSAPAPAGLPTAAELVLMPPDPTRSISDEHRPGPDELDLSSEEPSQSSPPPDSLGARTFFDPEQRPRLWLALFLLSLVLVVILGSFATIWFSDPGNGHLDNILTQIYSPLLTLLGVVLTFYFAQHIKRD